MSLAGTTVELALDSAAPRAWDILDTSGFVDPAALAEEPRRRYLEDCAARLCAGDRLAARFTFTRCSACGWFTCHGQRGAWLSTCRRCGEQFGW